MKICIALIASVLLLSQFVFGLQRGDILVVNTSSGVKVRSGPCTDYIQITILSQGTEVRFTGEMENGCGYTWYGVSGSFGNGYIASQFVSIKSGGSSSSALGSGTVSIQDLRAIMPNLAGTKASQYIGYLNSAMSEGNINSCCRMSAFLAQVAHESGDLNWFTEFASGAAYEGRKDLGNIYPGDGVRYKGRGPIQITGRANYRAAGQALGVDLENNPTRAADADIGFRTAVWFWNRAGLSQYADRCDQGGFDTCTKRINGGFNGKADRDNHWIKAKSILGC